MGKQLQDVNMEARHELPCIFLLAAWTRGVDMSCTRLWLHRQSWFVGFVNVMGFVDNNKEIK